MCRCLRDTGICTVVHCSVRHKYIEKRRRRMRTRPMVIFMAHPLMPSFIHVSRSPTLGPKSGVEHSGNNSGCAPPGSVTVDRCPRMCKRVFVLRAKRPPFSPPSCRASPHCERRAFTREASRSRLERSWRKRAASEGVVVPKEGCPTARRFFRHRVRAVQSIWQTM